MGYGTVEDCDAVDNCKPARDTTVSTSRKSLAFFFRGTIVPLPAMSQLIAVLEVYCTWSSAGGLVGSGTGIGDDTIIR